MLACVRAGGLHELVRSELPRELLEGLGLAVVNHGKHRISAQAERPSYLFECARVPDLWRNGSFFMQLLVEQLFACSCSLAGLRIVYIIRSRRRR